MSALRELVLSHLAIGPDGRAELPPDSHAPILAAFRRAAHTPDAEAHGIEMLDLVGLFRKSGDERAGDALVQLLVQTLEEMRFDDPAVALAAFRGDRSERRAPTAQDPAPAGSTKLHLLNALRRV